MKHNIKDLMIDSVLVGAFTTIFLSLLIKFAGLDVTDYIIFFLAVMGSILVGNFLAGALFKR